MTEQIEKCMLVHVQYVGQPNMLLSSDCQKLSIFVSIAFGSRLVISNVMIDCTMHMELVS
jgi:hypothetical protein